MVKKTSHARVTDPNAELAGNSKNSVIGMLSLVIVLILLAIGGWALYAGHWNPQRVAAPPSSTAAP
jgi:hypothetical protein